MEHDKRSADDEGQAFLSDGENERSTIGGPGKKRRMIFGSLRLGVEIAMLTFIIFLLAAKPYCGRDTIRRTPVPRCEFLVSRCSELEGALVLTIVKCRGRFTHSATTRGI
jgi:hypothetical protein